jgi:hypothetical protein
MAEPAPLLAELRTPTATNDATIVVFQHTRGEGLDLRARLPPHALKAIRATLIAVAGLTAAYLIGV